MDDGETDPFSTPRLPSGRHGLSKEFIEDSQRERIYAAVVDLITEKGYTAATANAVIKRAGVSSSTYYSLFTDKEDCFLAAHRWLLANLLAIAAEGYETTEGEWPDKMRQGLVAVVGALAKHPEIARVVMVELLGASPKAHDQYLNATNGFSELLSKGRELADDPESIPPESERMTIGAVSGIIFHEVLEDHAADLNRLLRDLVYITFVNYLGHERALAEMNRIR